MIEEDKVDSMTVQELLDALYGLRSQGVDLSSQLIFNDGGDFYTVDGITLHEDGSVTIEGSPT